MTTVAKGSALDVMSRAMTEAQLQEAVTGMLDHYRIRWHHETDSRWSKPGFPDLCIVGRAVEFWELKRQGGRLTDQQNGWLSGLVRAGAKARVVRPLDLLDGSVQQWVRGLR